MAARLPLPLLIWAAREVLRRPARCLLLFACLACLVFVLATALLFSRALAHTWDRLVAQAPDLVVRRIDAGGWAPLPAGQAVARAKAVPGVRGAVARLWGVAAGPDGPVTVVASPGAVPDDRLAGLRPPSAGQAIVGRKVADALSGTTLTLSARETLALDVVDTFPGPSDLATFDVVWVAPADARRLLGLAAGQASDLAVHLVRRQEETAIQADLAAAFAWPVTITARSDSALRHNTLAMRVGSAGVVAALPALLALLLLLSDVIAGRRRHQGDWGLLQALGWTSGNLVQLQVAAASIVGLPAVVAGLSLAYAAVFHPFAAGATAALLTGCQRLPVLALDPAGALGVMAEVAALVGIPYLATVFLTTLRGTAFDPWALMQAGSRN